MAPSWTFSDHFAGVGGFHAALAHGGGRCVFASEIDGRARAVYLRNWGAHVAVDGQGGPAVAGDIVPLTPADAAVGVPWSDVAAGGFPCQTFSKSGQQRGMEEARGTLVWNFLRVLEHWAAQGRPVRMVVLENVRNLAGPRHRHELATIVRALRELGYKTSSAPAVFSPHLLPPALGGTPQVRERVFLVGHWVGPDRALAETGEPPVVSRAPVAGWDPEAWRVEWILDDDADIPGVERYRLTQAEATWVRVWDDFVQVLRAARGGRLPGFPLWADAWRPRAGLRIPAGTPAWKADFLRKNAAFYDAHRAEVDAWRARWAAELAGFPASRRKLEWQARDAPGLADTVLQFRPSGIRAKPPTYLPALVAITQTSVVGSRGRRLAPHETARLQGLPAWFSFGDQPDAASYKQMGNAVAVGAVWHVFRSYVAAHAAELPAHLVGPVLAAPANPCPGVVDTGRAAVVDATTPRARAVQLLLDEPLAPTG